MKKLVAFLLTLTLLISMVGTVSLAADETKGTTFPKETVSVDASGNVSVTLPGVENFVTGYAWVLPKDAKEGTETVEVSLTFDVKKVAFVGKDASIAGGQVSSFWLYYNNPTQGIDAKNRVAVTNEALYSYYGSGDQKGKISYAWVEMEKTYETKNKDGNWVETKYTDDWQYISTNKNTGYISTDTSRTTVKTTGAKGLRSTSTQTETTKSYNWRSGAYTGKEIDETKKTYDIDGIQMTETVSHKEYNEDNKLLINNEGTTTTTYSADKTIKTDKEVYEGKEFSTKGLTKETTKSNSTSTSKFVKKELPYQMQTYQEETKVFNRDGELKETETYSQKWKDSDTLTAETYTHKYYNTYTGAQTYDMLSTSERINGKLVTQNNETRNNDDGSMRYKVVDTMAETDKAGVYETTEIRYNKDNKVVAKRDKDGTWTDANGKIIGWNVDKKTGEYYHTSVDFKERTGEIEGYRTQNTVKKDGITTMKTVAFKNGKQITDELKVTTDATGTYAKYKNGILDEVYTNNTKDEFEEWKYYDGKGTLQYSQKMDYKKGTYTTYDHRGKMTRIIESKTDGTYDMKVDPDTQIMTEMSKTFKQDNKDKKLTETITQYFNNVYELIYSTTKTKENNIDVTIYKDAAGKEFARQYNYSNYTGTLQDRQDIIDEPSVKSLDTTIERKVTKVAFEGKDTTTTKDFTKWTVSGGVKGAELTRKEVVKQVVKDAYNQTTVTKDGILTKDTVKEKNDYDDITKKTVTFYDWYSGKQSAKTKTFYPEEEDSPWTYSKLYDQYNNLQTYSEVDDTDSWYWTHTYYANGVLKAESWRDGLDNLPGGDSSYAATYFRNGALQSISTTNLSNGNSVEYNKDGTYYKWSDTVDGVTNTWLYDRSGKLTGYKWNTKSYGPNAYSFDYYDAAGNLIYSEKSETGLAGGAPDEYGIPKDVTVKTRTDPAGNVWTVTDGTNVTLTLKNGGSGWQSAVGKWFYIENGKPVQSAWRKIDGAWYYFDAEGAMAQGLITEEKKNLTAGDNVLDKAYALDAKTGALVVGGWVSVGDDRNTAWAFTDANGEVVTGWKQIGGKWYYFEEGWDNGHGNEYKAEAKWTQSGIRGKMVTGAAKVWNADGTQHTYFFNDDGSWDNSPGWKCAQVVVGSIGTDSDFFEDSDSFRNNFEGLEWHYYDKNGNEAKGWKMIDGEWYYFNEDGVMKNGWVKSGNNWYFMDRADGALATNGWVEDVYEGWYYMDKNGQYQTGWLKDGDTWYYLKQDGAMAENEWAKYGNNWYYMGSDGQIATGWVQDKGSWYYLKQDGAMKTGWEGSGNTWYYLGEDGAMLTNTDKTIDGKVYHFDENGLCTNP